MDSPLEPSFPAVGSSPGLPRDMAQRQIHIVMGKGGVGRSMAALGLALALHARGKRVLLCQVNTADAHGPLLGMPIGEELVEARPGLTCVNIEPAAARREYVMMVLRFRALYDAVFDNRFVQYFLRFVPSLAELNITGKIYFHAEEMEGNARHYEHVVVDAPATGHGVALMRVARVIASTAPSGPLKQQTLKMAAVFEDAARTAIHVITTPDELSVTETEELVARLRAENVGPLGVAVLNRIPRRLFQGVDETRLASLARSPAVVPHAAVAVERLQLERAVMTAQTRLAAAGLQVVPMNEAPGHAFGLDDVAAMSAAWLPPPRVVEAL